MHPNPHQTLPAALPLTFLPRSKQKVKIANIGTPSPKFRLIIDHGGVNPSPPLKAKYLSLGFGIITLLDAADPNAQASTTGLVKLVDTPR